jgi:hypothetical protein
MGGERVSSLRGRMLEGGVAVGFGPMSGVFFMPIALKSRPGLGKFAALVEISKD